MEEFDLFAVIIGSLLKILLIYILLGAIVIALVESIVTVTRWRGVTLQRHLLSAIGDKDLYSKIVNHPLLAFLGRYPSYINLDYCVLAIDDEVKKLDNASAEPQSRRNFEQNKFIQAVMFFRNLSSDLEGKHDKFKGNLRDWLLDLMRIASAKYKAQIQFLVITISFFLVVFLNLDFFEWVKLFNRNALWDSLTTLGEINDKIDKANLRALINSEKILPIGWSSGVPQSFPQIILKVAGLLASTIMTAFCALVSFQLLGNYVNIRGTSSKPTYV